jgi:hypothetical protein
MNTTVNGDNGKVTTVNYFARLENDDMLKTAQWGMSNNYFYLGTGGLIFKAEDSTSMYKGTRLSSSSLVIDGSNTLNSGNFGNVLSLTGNNIRFIASAALFNDGTT